MSAADWEPPRTLALASLLRKIFTIPLLFMALCRARSKHSDRSVRVTISPEEQLGATRISA